MTKAPFGSVQALIDDVRVLLLDAVIPYRYTDDELIVALNTALLEARRIRADLFVTRFGTAVPSYAAPSSEPFCMEPQFMLAFVYGTLAHALLRDDEDVQDQRANTFMTRFEQILTGAPPYTPISGGTPQARRG